MSNACVRNFGSRLPVRVKETCRLPLLVSVWLKVPVATIGRCRVMVLAVRIVVTVTFPELPPMTCHEITSLIISDSPVDD